jgi:adenylate cyclase
MAHPDARAEPRVARRRERSVLAVIAILLAGLPVAVWLDMQHIASESLQRQAADLNAMISGIRGYYARAVIERVMANSGHPTILSHTYENTPGAIPIPATLSLELGQVIAEKQSNVQYRFVSDLPFRGRAPHTLDDFERKGLERLRENPGLPPIVQDSGEGLSRRVRLLAPVVMSASCVSCHNSHPDSPKTDWRVGQVRGLQEIDVRTEIGTSLWSFKYSLAYFIAVAAAGLAFIVLQRRQNALIAKINDALGASNSFLSAISAKIAHYLSPQVYKSIFSGEMDVTLTTRRKKLTIFFSDIKDFTTLTEDLQPEALTELINEYFTAMSEIALRHGGTIDKFIGDALLVFFGDPESRGDAQDAQAAVRMAIDMQHALVRLNVQWRARGIEAPLMVRMGLNTGFCNVGNFGSAERMDYTILGAEANLAARLQSIAPPGGIICSYETFALVSDVASGHALEATDLKGIAREVVPYEITGLKRSEAGPSRVFSTRTHGLELYLDLSEAHDKKAVHEALQQAIRKLDHQEGDQVPARESKENRIALGKADQGRYGK